jgi:hypothetical protein
MPYWPLRLCSSAFEASLFLDVVPCHSLIGGWCFEMVWWFHHQGSEFPMKKILTLENETNTLSQNVGIYYPVMWHHIPEGELKPLFPIRPCHVVHGVFQLFPLSHWYIHTFIGKSKTACVYVWSRWQNCFGSLYLSWKLLLKMEHFMILNIWGHIH